MSSENNYDEELLSILSREGNILDFFDKIFDFLRRRTDYFRIKKNETDSLGLELGEAEEIIKNLIKKFSGKVLFNEASFAEDVYCVVVDEKSAFTDRPRSLHPEDFLINSKTDRVFCKHMKEAMEEQNINLESNIDPVPPDFVQEEIVSTLESTDAPDKFELETTAANSKANDPIKEVLGKPENATNTVQQHPDDLNDPKIPLMDPDCYNGGCCEGYTWSQTLKDIDINVKVSCKMISGKQVRVNTQQTRVKVEIAEGNEWKVLKEGKLTWKINVEESTWTLVPGEHILICLQKMQERWWDSAFASDPKIDLKAIDPSIPYEDLDRDSQVKIDELMYNEHLKRLGKPNIQQNKLHGILKNAWDAEGSPFKGQPFDPSLVNIQNADSFSS